MRVQSYLRGRTWWVRYRLHGRQVRRSLETQNRKIAEDLAVELEWQLRRGQQPAERRRTSIASYLCEYEAHSLASKRPKSHRTDMGRARAFIAWFEGDALQNVTTGDVSAFLTAKTLEDECSVTTILRYREVLHAFFQHAIRLGHVNLNPPRRAYPNQLQTASASGALSATPRTSTACRYLALGPDHIELPPWATDNSSWATRVVAAFYYSVVTLTTLGFGDALPASPVGAVLVTVQVILGHIILGLLVSVLADKVARRS